MIAYILIITAGIKIAESAPKDRRLPTLLQERFMKISTRLGSGFGTLIVFFSLCIVVAIHSLYQSKNALESIVQGDMKKQN